MRLGYLSAKWSKVLKDVAKGFDKTLVADRVPSGRFTRHDREKYDAIEALKILNRNFPLPCFFSGAIPSGFFGERYPNGDTQRRISPV